MKELIGKPVAFTEKYIFLDVETANSQGNICQIAAIVCSDGQIVKVIDELINPNAEFMHDSKHTGLHGIDEETVKDSPTIKEVWEKQFDFYSKDYIFVGHNVVSADSTWLLNDLRRYNINLGKICCYDTLEIAKCFLNPEIYGNANFKLSTLCRCLNITQNKVHNALDDALACFNLLNFIIENNSFEITDFKYFKRLPLTVEERQALNELLALRNKYSDNLKVLKSFKKAMRANDNDLVCNISIEHSIDFIDNSELYKLLVGIPDDAVYTKEEMTQISCAIRNVQDDLDAIKAQINEYFLPARKKNFNFFSTSSNHTQKPNISEIAASTAVNEEKDADFDGKTFVITGEFKTLTREQALKKIVERGGMIKSGVSKAVDFLVNADNRTSTKTKDAEALQTKGHPIKIITEEQFMRMLESNDAIDID